jgi:N-acetylglutamate synthase-like GNAT family acetyltransferase
MPYAIRCAVQADQNSINSIVRAAGINPFNLRWPRFLVAEEDGRVIGVVQVKPHRDGSRELASLAVIPERRDRGVGSALVGAILAAEAGPVHLTCADRLEGYYARFGFRSLALPEMPPYFRRLSRLTRALSAVLRALGQHWRILVMVRPGAVV